MSKCNPNFVNAGDLHYEQGYQQGRADAIDEFVQACECINLGGFNVYLPFIKQIGEQLKEKANE